MSTPEPPLVLVTHPRNRLATYFGATALSQLRQVAGCGSTARTRIWPALRWSARRATAPS